MILGSYLTSLIKTSNISNFNFAVHFFFDTIKPWKYKAQTLFFTHLQIMKAESPYNTDILVKFLFDLIPPNDTTTANNVH